MIYGNRLSARNNGNLGFFGTSPGSPISGAGAGGIGFGDIIGAGTQIYGMHLQAGIKEDEIKMKERVGMAQADAQKWGYQAQAEVAGERSESKGLYIAIGLAGLTGLALFTLGYVYVSRGDDDEAEGE